MRPSGTDYAARKRGDRRTTCECGLGGRRTSRFSSWSRPSSAIAILQAPSPVIARLSVGGQGQCCAPMPQPMSAVSTVNSKRCFKFQIIRSRTRALFKGAAPSAIVALGSAEGYFRLWRKITDAATNRSAPSTGTQKAVSGSIRPLHAHSLHYRLGCCVLSRQGTTPGRVPPLP